MSFGARALIRLDALRHNFECLRGLAGRARLMAVVKANAYGHGLVDIAGNLSDADALAVARLAEAQQLRSAGISTPLLHLSGPQSAADWQGAAELDCEVVVHCDAQLDLAEKAAAPLRVWLKVDTGMGRLGFSVSEFEPAVQRLRAARGIAALRLMTHFANADQPGHPLNTQQVERFRAVCDGFDGDISIANSPALLSRQDLPTSPGDFGQTGEVWVRPGLALYGASPFAGSTGRDHGLRPVMTFEAPLIAVRRVAAGTSVGYGSEWTATTATRIGIVAAGYGDGYSRHCRQGTPLWLNGREVRVIGRISMDMLAVELDDRADDTVGDVAELWGDNIAVERVADNAGALAYDLLCGIMHREATGILE